MRGLSGDQRSLQPRPRRQLAQRRFRLCQMSANCWLLVSNWRPRQPLGGRARRRLIEAMSPPTKKTSASNVSGPAASGTNQRNTYPASASPNPYARSRAGDTSATSCCQPAARLAIQPGEWPPPPGTEEKDALRKISSISRSNFSGTGSVASSKVLKAFYHRCRLRGVRCFPFARRASVRRFPGERCSSPARRRSCRRRESRSHRWGSDRTLGRSA